MSRKLKEAAFVPDVKRRVPTIKVRCGDCLFLKKAGVYKDSKGIPQSCESFGTVSGADTCAMFTINPTKFDSPIGPALQVLAQLENPAVLAATLISAARVSRSGFNLGQEVFFHVMGADYVNNYASGRVVGATRDQIVVEGCGRCTALLKPESAMLLEQWREKLAMLLRANKINDPDGGLRHVEDHTGVSLRMYRPPLIATEIGKRRRTHTESPKSSKRAAKGVAVALT